MAYYWEPFPDTVYIDIKNQISDNMSNADLASAYADVSNKLGGLMHELDDPDYFSVRGKVEQSFAMWQDLEEDLYDRIVSILRSENEAGSHHILTGLGTHFVVLPFMEREGYRDGSGWWISTEQH